MEISKEKIKARLLYHLRKKRVIVGAHTHYDTLRRGFPTHLGKDVKIVADELIKVGLLLTKPTSYGLQVSLNKDKIIEIDEFIRKELNLDF